MVLLVEGPGDTTMGMNTQIGDFTAFFFTAGLMACIGAFRNQHIWALIHIITGFSCNI